MKFGLSFLPDCDPSQRSATTYFADALSLAKLADDGGFHSVKMTEHYLHQYGGFCPSPLIFLTAVAMQTKRIRLMTGCMLASFHHPIQVASETAMVDTISGGRLEVGLARGFLPYEFEAFGIPMDESRRRYEEAISAIRRLWTEPSVTADGPYFRLHDASILPRPLQKPHPPVWGVGVRSRESFAWIGQQGLSLLVALTAQTPYILRDQVEIYREAFATERGDAAGTVGLLVPLCVRGDSRSAVEAGSKYLTRHHKTWADAASAWNGYKSCAYPSYTGMANVIREATPNWLIEAQCVAFGCPSSIVDFIGRIQEIIRPEQILWYVDFGGMPIEHSRRTVELFVQDVMPHFK